MYPPVLYHIIFFVFKQRSNFYIFQSDFSGKTLRFPFQGIVNKLPADKAAGDDTADAAQHMVFIRKTGSVLTKAAVPFDFARLCSFRMNVIFSFHG